MMLPQDLTLWTGCAKVNVRRARRILPSETEARVEGLTIAAQPIRLSADVGGTFTDVAAFDEATGELKLGKTLSTPSRLVAGIEAGVVRAGSEFQAARLFLHGTTVAINTILERTGSRCALITTQGFRDIYEIGRVNRPESYNLFFRRHAPLIERDLRYEVRERIDAQGRVLIRLDEEQVRAALADAVAQGVEAIAILFLHSYRNPGHEQRVKAIVEQSYPQLFVTASHELSQEYREFERTSTVAANAYIGPRVRHYLSEMGEHLEHAGFDGNFLIVQSTGGLFDVDDARRSCIRMLESGPAAGVIGTKALCDAIGLRNAIAFDMGGTTAKAGVIHEGNVLMTGSALMGGYATGLPVQMSMIDIQEVGTGGGSIARVEVGGALRVGPQSAGAQPGPVCYGLGGTRPTVTDANLILGRLGADRFLGGEMRLDVEAARAALAREVAEPLGLDLVAGADGILRIATTQMGHVVRWVTTERGLDAGDFALVAYGGAGPLHAVMVARELAIRTVVIPRAPGHFSACGMLVADLRRDFVHTWFTPLAEASFAEMEAIFAEMEARGRETVTRGRATLHEIAVTRGADMRYVGQEHAVTVDLPVELFRNQDRDGIKQRFDAVHDTRYGYSVAHEKAEIVSLRSAVLGLMRKPPFEHVAAGGAAPAAEAHQGTRPVYFGESGGFVDTPTFRRGLLAAGNRIAGPALVEEHASTTVVHPGDTLTVDAFGDLVIVINRS
jgi:N-methylhydantoinase A